MVEVRVNFPLDDNEVKRIFNALDLRYDTKHALVFGKYCNNEFMRDETMVAETISQYVSSECSFRGIGVDSVIESLEGNDIERNSLLSDPWEND